MFRVDWTSVALSQLAAIWTNVDAPTRRQITRSTQEIDARLSTSADQVGESRMESIRIHYVPPLGFNFHVHQPSRTAVVFRIWLVRKRT